MIDLHCHLLPGVDDGALDDADSLAMARVAAADGITAICATPHIRHDHDVRLPELPGRRAVLQAHLDAHEVALRVLPGGEVAETAVPGLSDDELRAVSLGGGGRWILLEPRPGALSTSLVETIAALRSRGFRALVAHPERHLGDDFFARLTEAVAGGALVQGTAAFVTDGPAADGMAELARRGLLHVLGSDAHSSHGGRAVRLAAALARLAELPTTGPHAAWVAEAAPAAIVAGEDVEAPYGPSA